MRGTQTVTLPTVVRASGDEPEITITTSAVDREGDIIEPDGAELAEYQRNPVVGFGHFRQEPLPIGVTTSITQEPGRGLRARWQWLEGDAFAARVRNAWDQGVLRAASVGFLPLAFEPRKDGRGMRYTRWSLLEWSLCPIPANPEAVRVLRSLGLPVDESDEIVLPLADEPAGDPEIRVRASTLSAMVRAEVRVAVAPLLARVSKRAAPAEAPERFDVDKAWLARVTRDALYELVGRETRAAINRARGRID